MKTLVKSIFIGVFVGTLARWLDLEGFTLSWWLFIIPANLVLLYTFRNV